VDQPADRPPVIVVRIPTIVVRLAVAVAAPVTAVVRQPAAELAPGTPPPPPPPPPGPGACLRRLAGPAARVLGIAAILAAAIVVVSVVPAWAARLVREGHLWNLGGLLPGPSSGVSSILPLLLSSLVVLAVVSSHSGHHHHHDRW
jgi:hypothetical protein